MNVQWRPTGARGARDGSWRDATRLNVVATLPRVAAALVIAEAALVLLGWALDSPLLKSLHPQWVSTKANTALLLGLTGAAMALLDLQRPGGARVLGRALGALVAAFAAVTLAQDLGGWDLGIDQLLFRDADSVATGMPGRMAPNTAICFVLLGIALAATEPVAPASRRARAREPLVLLCGALTLLALLGYAFGDSRLLRFEQFTSVAVPTLLGLLIATVGALSLRPLGPFMTVLTSQGLAGHMSRRLIPAAILVPLTFGFARLVGEHQGLFEPEFALAAHLVANVVAFCAIAWWSAATLGSVDDRRQAAMAAVEAESAARELARARLEAVLDVLPVAVWLGDATGKLVQANAAAREIWGPELPAVESVEAYSRFRGWWTSTGEPLAPDDWGMARALRGAPLTAQELDVEGFDGRRRTILNYAAPIRDERGVVTGAVAVNVDLTDRKRTERELAALRAELEERVRRRTAELAAANAELEAFSYSVSHDLRAPLRWIDGFSRALAEDQEDRLDDVGRDHLRQIRESVQHMADLVDALLRLSRITRVPLERGPVDLTALAREVAHELDVAEPARAVEWRLEEGLTVMGDAKLLRVAMDNLLRNAWKFTRERDQARIELGARTTDGRRVYYVRDNGVGFDMAYAGKLFVAFERLHRSSEFEGTGIGLPLVSRVIQRHGGRVWGEGEPGVGATFSFTLEEPSEATRP